MAGRVSLRLKEWGKNFLAFIFGLGLIVVALEIALRFLPVVDIYHFQRVDQENYIPRFAPEGAHITYSLGWNFYQVAKKRINNLGFFNDLDYKRNPDKPVIAVIGDSYVEAMQVDNGETFFSLLQRATDRYYFYSFGASGSQLSTYLAYVDYAEKNFKPNKIIIPIISNDFDESFYEVKKAPGFWYFDGSGKPYVIEYTPEKSTWLYVRRSIAKKSVLLRYLYFNLGLPAVLQRLKGFTGPQRNIPDMELSKKAIDFFFEKLPEYTTLRPRDIVFVVDAPREYIYQGTIDEAKKSTFGVIRDYFIKEAQKRNYVVVDMLPVFYEHYRTNGKRFEFPTDGHWNELGHYLVAQELKKVLNLSR